MKTVIVIPAYNEEKIIQDNVLRVVQAARSMSPDNIDIVLVDNNSTDATGAIMRALEAKYRAVTARHEPRQGKGHAILNVWEELKDNYDTFIFMDADLATSLESLPRLVQEIYKGNDIVIGSRYHRDSIVTREKRRKLASTLYRTLAKRTLNSSIDDFPCGFKAVSKKIVTEVVPQIQERTWFFDTELLHLAEKGGYAIQEIPVYWKEPRTKENASRLNLPRVSIQYIQGLRRLKKRL